MSQTRTVLVVEDDPDLRDAIELLLIQQGYHVVSTGNGLRAVELADQHRIHAALVDILIPGQSGFQVTSELKARSDEVRVAVMSGNVSQAHLDYAFAAGAEQFLAKPFTAAQLLDVVTSLCPPPEESPSPTLRRAARIGS
jgi:DNA-binding response OmpR family regulator